MTTESLSSGLTYTADQRKVAGDALYIFHGACNGLAVSKTLTEAYKAFGPGTDSRNTAVPVRIILVQLCHLAGIDVSIEFPKFDKWLTACEQIAGFKLVNGVKEPIDGSASTEVSP